MSLLPLLFWIVLILSIIGVYAPASWPNAARISGTAWIALFIIIGLRIFKVAVQ